MVVVDDSVRAVSMPLPKFLRLFKPDESGLKIVRVEEKFDGFYAMGTRCGSLWSKNHHSMETVRPELYAYWREVVWPVVRECMYQWEVLIFECCLMNGGERVVDEYSKWPASFNVPEGRVFTRPGWEGGYTDLPSLWKDVKGMPVRFVLIGSNNRSSEDLVGVWETPRAIVGMQAAWDTVFTKEGVVALLADHLGNQYTVKVKSNMLNPVPLCVVAMAQDDGFYSVFYYGFRDGDTMWVVAKSDFRDTLVPQAEPNGKAHIEYGSIRNYHSTSKSKAADAFNALNHFCRSKRAARVVRSYSPSDLAVVTRLYTAKTTSSSLGFHRGLVYLEEPWNAKATVGTNNLYHGKSLAPEDVRLQCVSLIALHSGGRMEFSYNGLPHPDPPIVRPEALAEATRLRSIRSLDRADHYRLLYSCSRPPTMAEVLAMP